MKRIEARDLYELDLHQHLIDIYSHCDPLTITENDGVFSMRGVTDADDLTVDDLASLLVCLGLFHVKEEYCHLWGEDITPDTDIDGEEVDTLSRQWEKPLSELLDQLEVV